MILPVLLLFASLPWILGFSAWDDTTVGTVCTTSNPKWDKLLATYSAAHASTLATLDHHCPITPPALQGLSVYRMYPRESWIGLGDFLPGVANVFLSALRRNRLFLLHWEGIDTPEFSALLHPPPTLSTFHPWQGVADGLSVHSSVAQWDVVKGEVKGNASTWPLLWGKASVSTGRSRDIEIHTHFNQGALSLTAHTSNDTDLQGASKWLMGILPRLEDGSVAWGCVYRAILRLSPALQRKARGSLALPPPSPPKAPASLVCLHLRTWYFSRPTDEEDDTVVKATECLDHALSKVGNADTAVFLASDNVDARRVIQDHIYPRRLFASKFAPQHVAYQENATEGEIGEAFETSLMDFFLLSGCQHIVLPINSGFSRSAAVSGRASIWFSNEFSFLGLEGNGEPCKTRGGKDRMYAAYWGSGI